MAYVATAGRNNGAIIVLDNIDLYTDVQHALVMY
jgi:hypothetical protein